MRLSTTGRLSGLDAARTTAILGMFAAHVFPLYHQDPLVGGSVPTVTGWLAAGRASALFMVLAGVSLGLFCRSLQRRGLTRLQVTTVILRRALVIAALGMLLGPANERIANILVHYGLLFAVLAAAVFLPARILGPAAVLWLALTPVAWRPLAALLEPKVLGHNPTFVDLAHPVLLLQDLVVTGYYPLLVWCGFGLLGLWLSRFALGQPRTAWWFFAGGTAIAAATFAAGWFAAQRFLGELASTSGMSRRDASTALLTGRSAGGNLDAFLGDPRYLWLPTPHSTSPVASVHAAACAVAVLGIFLLLTDRLGYVGQLIAAAGRAPLTLYAGHLILLPILQLFFRPTTCWWILCATVLLTALTLARTGRSAPLEAGVRYLSGVEVATAK